MSRVISAIVILIASTVASSAQGFFPAIWRGDQGSIVKVLRTDAATGNFTGIYINGTTGPCPGVRYDVAGQIRGQRIVFRTSRDWTENCRATVVWAGRILGPTTIATRRALVTPNGRLVRERRTITFQRI
jgi:hypothetical protein